MQLTCEKQLPKEKKLNFQNFNFFLSNPNPNPNPNPNSSGYEVITVIRPYPIRVGVRPRQGSSHSSCLSRQKSIKSCRRLETSRYRYSKSYFGSGSGSGQKSCRASTISLSSVQILGVGLGGGSCIPVTVKILPVAICPVSFNLSLIHTHILILPVTVNVFTVSLSLILVNVVLPVTIVHIHIQNNSKNNVFTVNFSLIQNSDVPVTVFTVSLMHIQNNSGNNYHFHHIQVLRVVFTVSLSFFPVTVNTTNILIVTVTVFTVSLSLILTHIYYSQYHHIQVLREVNITNNFIVTVTVFTVSLHQSLCESLFNVILVLPASATATVSTPVSTPMLTCISLLNPNPNHEVIIVIKGPAKGLTSLIQFTDTIFNATASLSLIPVVNTTNIYIVTAYTAFTAFTVSLIFNASLSLTHVLELPITVTIFTSSGSLRLSLILVTVSLNRSLNLIHSAVTFAVVFAVTFVVIFTIDSAMYTISTFTVSLSLIHVTNNVFIASSYISVLRVVRLGYVRLG
jgi:hypothetical protein